MNKLVISIGLVFLLALTSFAGDYVVIVNTANSTTSVSETMLKRLYTGRASELDGTRMVPINQQMNSPLAESFLTEVVGQNSAEYIGFWVTLQIQGVGSAPMSQANDAAVINMVSAIPGAIGYISEASVTDAVKVITLN